MKKNKTIMLLTLGCVMSLSLTAYACVATNSKDSILDSQVELKMPITAPALEGEITDDAEVLDVVQFKGKIDSIDGDEAIVTPDKGEDIRSSGDAVRINIADYSKPLNKGYSVTIYYDGVIMDSYPLQINLLGINDEMFDIEEPSISDDFDEAVSFDNSYE
ncbi:hypothetical protein ACIZ62_14270 [Acetobacterium carbinolicum]|uniref:hypothetical protein n=1 Tax=Acetobacterium TaxID=33951 RepID=UPI000DBEBEC9|nr:hypothetical protein [Acetobacterium sp. KB-1]AWW28089.1 hypothetical protein DOZ58_16390 [Acetobacterium sp. KB-1]